MNSLPLFIFWALAAWAATSRRPVLLYLFFGSMPFGAFAVLPPTLTGGLTFTATPVVALLIIARALMSRDGPHFMLNAAMRPNRLALLFLFWIVAVIATIFMPRLFAGQVMVVPMRGVLDETSPLVPTAQNISQLAYLTISIFAVFGFAHRLQDHASRQQALRALCFGGAVAVLTGLLDYASSFLPLDPLLAPFRTATYSLATNVEVLGQKRVVGLMPEASAFGGLCLPLLSAIYFFRRAILDRTVREIYAPILIGLLLLCCWLSTSSATYVGVAVLFVLAVAEWLLRVHYFGEKARLYRRGLMGELSVVVSLVVVLALVVMLRPTIVEPVFALIDRMIFQKTSSSSFEERGMWRTVALESTFKTYGAGVGVGSTRASSSLVAIISNTGIIGALLYYSFVIQTLLRSPAGMRVEDQLILSGFRFSFAPAFIVTLLVGATDFGALTAFGFGIVSATVIAAERERKAQELARYGMLHEGVEHPPGVAQRDWQAPRL